MIKKRIIAVVILMALALLAVSCRESPAPASPSAAAPAVVDENAETEAPVVTDEPAVTDEPVVTDEPAVTDEPVATDEPAEKTIYDMYPSLAEAKKYEKEHELTVMDRFDMYATDAQWEELQNAPKNSLFAVSLQRERLIREILGDIPEGTPRITLEQARKICSEHHASDYGYQMWAANDALVEKFSEYAVPDWNFGDGGLTACFFLDDEPTRYIQIWPTTVLYFDLETGSEEVLWKFE